MTSHKGSWDFLRIIFGTTIPTILIAFVGGQMIWSNNLYIYGLWLLFISVALIMVQLFLTCVVCFKKRVGCNGCPFNTSDKFLSQFERDVTSSKKI